MTDSDESQTPEGPGARLWVALALIAIGLVVVAKLVMFPGPQVSASEVTGTVEIYDAPLRFVYHRVSGQASMFDLEVDPKSLDNLIESRPEDAARLRKLLEHDLGVKSLDELRDNGRATQILRSLGYIGGD